MSMPIIDQMIITISPAPIVSAGSDQTVCGDIAHCRLKWFCNKC